ncbi:MAG: ATP-dependent metallopeptidase FtsH/Yme1/Tma family protein, partial [Bacteroidota bacterium]
MPQQDDFKQNDKSNFPRFKPRNDEDNNNNTPRKAPRFNIYWVWAIIAAVLIGFQLFGSFTPDAHQVSELEFRKNMLTAGDVEKIDLISNKSVVRVYIKKDSLQKPFYRDKLNKNGWPSVAASKDGPQFEFRVTDVKEYEKELRDFFAKNPQVTEVPIDSHSEGDWIPGVLQIVLPILIIVLIWVMLMRKMGGQAGSGGPGGIFNIGKSKATLFDKGTKVNITFSDVAGLDEAKVKVM